MGIEIAKSNQSKVLNRFYCLDLDRAGNFSGKDLGLALVNNH